MLQIRPYQTGDASQVAAVWHRSGLEEYDYLPDFQALTPETALAVFQTVIQPGADIQVAWEGDVVVGYLALRGSYVDRLYVDPSAQGRGVGGRLLAFAKTRCPLGLELHTHQQNVRARTFYERAGFHAVKFGVSPAPELVPDVEYHWRPDGV